jgi:exosortase/archaeosortase family protein
MASPGATAYSLRALALSVGLFGVLRLAWVEANLLAPFTAFQGKLAVWGGSGVPSLVQVGLNCSGADALALCLAFVALWPSRLDLKLAGLVGGVLVVVSVNVARIASLVRMEGSAWFPALHEYVWPALLTLTSAAYVFVWMTRVATAPCNPDRRLATRRHGAPSACWRRRWRSSMRRRRGTCTRRHLSRWRSGWPALPRRS